MRQRSVHPASYLIPIALLFVVIIAFGIVRWVHKPFAYRYSIAIVAENILHVISLSSSLDSAVAFTIPMDTVIPATQGYGDYRLDSLLALDLLEKKHGTLFSSSIKQAFGVPIQAHVQSNIQTDSTFALLQHVFRISSYRSLSDAIPFVDWFRLVIGSSRLRQGSVTTFDLAHSRYTKRLPDESSQEMLDGQKADFIIGSRLYDGALRSENKSVGVFNTTKIPNVGTKAALLLKHVGISVLTVGNTDEQRDQCALFIRSGDQKSSTVQFLISQFDCELIEQEEQEYDIELHLGNKNAN